MSQSRSFRTEEDLERTVRAIAREFKTDQVFIVGSQSILLAWPDSPQDLRASPEIDAYPANAKIWEVAEKKKDNPLAEASEHIDALFGSGSLFHKAHGFFIDGVDENTARLPKGWHRRALVRRIDVDGRQVRAVAPCPEDLIVSKLARLEPKDKAFVETYHAARPLKLDLIEQRIHESDFDPAIAVKAIAYVRTLSRKQNER